MVDYDPSKVIVLDTETTGLSPEKDEVLSLAIVDGSGNELFYSLFKPEHRRAWKDAERINHIGTEDVKGAPKIREEKGTIESILSEAELIVGYNLRFDLDMLEAAGVSIPRCTKYDVMPAYANIHGEWAEWKHDWKWQKLSTCADHYGYRFDAHDALGDAKATAYCFWKVREDIFRKDAEDGSGVTRTELLLCIFLGPLGAHRFYRKEWKMGALYLCTVGLLCVGWIADCFRLGKAYFASRR